MYVMALFIVFVEIIKYLNTYELIRLHSICHNPLWKKNQRHFQGDLKYQFLTFDNKFCFNNDQFFLILITFNG